jgi:acyl-coenzyme A synthetase/AMP-(fatty) acid ligase
VGRRSKPGQTLIANLLLNCASARSNAIALIDGDREVTYAQLCAQVRGFARWLESVGVQSGDRVVLHLRKCIEEVIATLGAMWARVVVVNVHPQWSLDQLKGVLDDCTPRLVFTDARKAASLVDVAAFAEYRDRFVSVGVTKAEFERSGEGLAWPELDATLLATSRRIASANVKLDDSKLDEIAVLLYTSGSTGRPKGVMHSHRNLSQFGSNVAQYLNARPTDRVLSVLPLSFGYGLSQLLLTVVSGAALVLAKVPFPSTLVDTLIKHEITGFAAVPSVWNQMVQVLKDTPRVMPSLRYLTNAGGRLFDGDEARLAQCFPNVPLYTMYGSTESLRSTFLDPIHFTSKPGAIGKAVPNVDIFVVRSDGSLCADDEEGELVHAGWHISQGYYRQPEATATRFRPLHAAGIGRAYFSGDIVRRDAEGVLWFVSREDWMLKVNGFRFSVHEVEAALERCEFVTRAVVVGALDAEARLVIHAVVQPIAGKPTEPGALERYVWKHLPSYMQPNAYHIWADPWPLTPTGKLDRITLMKRITERSTSGKERSTSISKESVENRNV